MMPDWEYVLAVSVRQRGEDENYAGEWTVTLLAAVRHDFTDEASARWSHMVLAAMRDTEAEAVASIPLTWESLPRLDTAKHGTDVTLEEAAVIGHQVRIHKELRHIPKDATEGVKDDPAPYQHHEGCTSPIDPHDTL